MADVTAALDTFKDVAICGSEGRRILVASVPVAASAASTAISAKVEETSGRGAAAIVATVWSAMGLPVISHDRYHIKRDRELQITHLNPSLRANGSRECAPDD